MVRTGKWAQEFPERKRAVIIYPVISGLRNPTVLQRVRLMLEVKNIFDADLSEYRADTWLQRFSYRVNYNGNYILDITFAQSGIGAYPDTQTRHFAINLKDGSVLKASEVFLADKLELLAELVNAKLQSELKQIARNNGETDPEQREALADSHKDLRFSVENLDEFSVGPNGLTFLYDAGFPHAIEAFEPQGRYFFSYSELKPFIKRDGLLGRFVR